MALDWSACPAVESVPGKVSGAWVFRGTRLPVATIFENLEDGLTVEEIMEQAVRRNPRANQRRARFRCAQPGSSRPPLNARLV